MTVKKVKKGLSKPKLTFNNFRQLIFIFKEVIKIAFRVSPGLLLITFFVNMIWGFSAVPGFYLEKLILDRIVSSIGVNDWQPVLYILALLILARLVLELIRNLLSSISAFTRNILASFFDAEIEVLVGNKLAETDLSIIEESTFRNRFEKIKRESSSRAWGLILPLADIPNYIVGFLSAAAVLVLLNPLIAVGVLITAIPQLLIDSKFVKKNYDLEEQVSPLRVMWGWLLYYLFRSENYHEQKLLGLSDTLTNKLRGVQREILEKHKNLRKKEEIFRILGYLPFLAFEYGVSIWVLFLVIMEKITIGSFELFLRSLRSAQQNLTSLGNSFLQIYENYIFVADLVWFLNLKSEVESDKDKGEELKSKTEPIQLKNVWFKYKDKQDWILNSIDLKISPGEKIAIVGKNGAGKSTLIKLIARFYDPDKGKISIGKQPLKDIKLKDWRNNVTILFQDFSSYAFSVREAVGFGDVSRLSDTAGIKKAISQTKMTEYVNKLPLRLDNPLTPDFKEGTRPSAGQWQRLGISRSIFRKNAGVIIMDEPTSNVDPEAEEEIFEELVKISKNRILIFVTQRFSTTRIADRILVVDEGKIIEDGSHRELMNKNGTYAKLFRLQAKGYKDT